MKTIKHFDAFAGMGGFTLALKNVFGELYENVGFAEIDKHATACYQHHFKEHKHYGDITTIRPGDIGHIDIFTFGSPSKISHWLENVRGLKGKGVALSHTQLTSLLTPDQVYLSGKMLKEHSPQTVVQTLSQFSKPLPTLGAIDLNGNCLIQSGFYPKIESEFTLSDILQPPHEISDQYFLSEKTTTYLTERKKQKTKTKSI